MRHEALPVLVVVALVAVGTAGAVMTDDGTVDQTSNAVTTATELPNRTISVSGDGSASATPDKAVVTVVVSAEGDDPASVRDDLASGASDLRTELGDAGVDEAQINSEDYRIHENREPRVERRATTTESDEADTPAYRGTHAFEVELDDTDAVESVIDAAANSGATVAHVQFTLAEDTREQLRDEALTNAVDDARGQADTLATAGNLQVDSVVSIDATDRSYDAVSYRGEQADAAASGDTSIDVGDASVSVDVQVVYAAGK